jgi:hypothetical protein
MKVHESSFMPGIMMKKCFQTTGISTLCAFKIYSVDLFLEPITNSIIKSTGHIKYRLSVCIIRDYISQIEFQNLASEITFYFISSLIQMSSDLFRVKS